MHEQTIVCCRLTEKSTKYNIERKKMNTNQKNLAADTSNLQ